MGLDICHVKLAPRSKQTIEYFLLEEFRDNLLFIENHKDLIESLEDSGEVTQVIFYESAGYQRKRMSKEFIKEFQNDKLYFLLSDVIKAKAFLQAREGESQSELANEFQKNFIDNFAEGKSIFFISH